MKSLLKSLALITLAAFAAAPLSAALPGAEPLAKLIVKEFDTNSDDSIDSGEWQRGIADNFQRIDANGDGSLQPDEPDTLNKDISEEMGELVAGLIIGLIKQGLLSLDSDGDKLISRKEYDTLSTSIFTKLDADKNNSLSLAELSELPVKMITR